MEKLRVIIIDDEPIARQEINRLLGAYQNIDVIAEAANIIDGEKCINELNPDVIFLDIEMPGGTGLQLAETLAGKYPVIFCTAYNEFAVDAFGLNAIDYLVKPIVKERLFDAIKRIPVSRLESKPEPLADNFKLMVKFADYMKVISLGEIIRFESVGNHAAIYTSKGKAFVHSSLNKIESRLCSSTYFRASRVDILRIDAIEKLEQNINYGLTAELNNGAEVTISRRQTAKLKAQLGFPEL